MARLATSLVNLRHEIDTMWPNRSRALDGWVNSNPWVIHQNDHGVAPNGQVHAIDVTRNGIDPMIVVNACRAHPGVCRYVIYNRLIYEAKNGMRPEDYHGTPNPHTDHVHVSIEYTTAAENFSGSWGIHSVSGIGAAVTTSSGINVVTAGPWDIAPAVFALSDRLRLAGDRLAAAYYQLMNLH